MSDEPPLADAGPTQQVEAGTLVTLNGANSRDAETQGPSAVTFDWQQWPDTAPRVTLSSATAARPTFTAPLVTQPTTLTFTLRVTDNEGSFADAAPSAMVTVSPVNQPPVALTGPTQSVREETVVTLDASQSFDPGGTPLTFAWRQTASPAVTLSNPTVARPTFSAPLVSGASLVLVFELRVTDANGLMGTATAFVNVGGTPPSADPGPPQTVFAGDIVTLDASQSRDARGAPIVAFRWRHLTGPPVTLSDVTANGTIVAIGALTVQRTVVNEDSGGDGGASSSGGSTLQPGTAWDGSLPDLLLGLLAWLLWRSYARQHGPPPRL